MTYKTKFMTTCLLLVVALLGAVFVTNYQTSAAPKAIQCSPDAAYTSLVRKASTGNQRTYVATLSARLSCPKLSPKNTITFIYPQICTIIEVLGDKDRECVDGFSVSKKGSATRASRVQSIPSTITCIANTSVTIQANPRLSAAEKSPNGRVIATYNSHKNPAEKAKTFTSREFTCR